MYNFFESQITIFAYSCPIYEDFSKITFLVIKSSHNFKPFIIFTEKSTNLELTVEDLSLPPATILQQEAVVNS